MAKPKTIFCCNECGSEQNRWIGQCPDCKSWNSLVETTALLASKSTGYSGYSGITCQAAVTPIKDVIITNSIRQTTYIKELDRVLGGGLVDGSVILIGGDPGIGKSTLLIQAISKLSHCLNTLYVTGEESLQQVSERANRLDLDCGGLKLYAETSIEKIIHTAEKEAPKVMVIDSIQTIYTSQITSAPGSVSQLRESTAQLVRFAKQSNTAIFLVGHVTKDGSLAGPRVLEHMVDTVLYFEGDNSSRFRMIRAIKNRFGAINELGVFAMTDKGLREVNNPSAIFLTNRLEDATGSIIMITMEGSRPILIEVQSLVDQNQGPMPKRVALGIDQNRLSMLLAVLHKHGQIQIQDQDVYINVVGGVKITETAVDLALIAAVLSSFKNRPLDPGLIIFGEVGLAGEIRPVPNGMERLKEAIKHGFKRVILPHANAPKKPVKDIEIIAVKKLSDVLEALY